MSRFLLTAILLLLTSTVQAEDRALLIGINSYQNVRGLKGTHNDVQAIKNLLTTQLGFKLEAIKVLEDSEASKAGILQAMDEWLLQGSKSGDHVVFYYSGHGDQLDDTNGDEADKRDEAIIAFDALADGTNWVLDDEIATRMAQLKDRYVLAMFDSCHSGSVTRGAFNDEDTKTPDWNTRSLKSSFDPVHQKEGGFIKGDGNTIAFFAVAPNQEAIDDRSSEPRRPHGVFTDALVQGIKGAADYNHDGEVSFEELLAYSRQQSDQYCNKYKKGCAQNPLTPMLEIANGYQGKDIRNFTRSSFTAKPPATVPLPHIASSVIVHDNPAKLQLNMLPASRVSLGTPMLFTIKTPRTGKLMLFDIGASNKITPLFPNSFQTGQTLASCKKSAVDGTVQANTTIVLPDKSCMNFVFTAQEPVGKGKIIAVLIEDLSVDTRDLLNDFNKSSFNSIPQPELWLNQLSNRLNALVNEPDGGNRASQSSMTTLDYEITR